MYIVFFASLKDKSTKIVNIGICLQLDFYFKKSILLIRCKNEFGLELFFGKFKYFFNSFILFFSLYF